MRRDGGRRRSGQPLLIMNCADPEDGRRDGDRGSRCGVDGQSEPIPAGAPGCRGFGEDAVNDAVRFTEPPCGWKLKVHLDSPRRVAISVLARRDRALDRRDLAVPTEIFNVAAASAMLRPDQATSSTTSR